MGRYDMENDGMQKQGYRHQNCSCPSMGTQQFRTTNLTEQTGKATGLVNLGKTAYFSGKAITYTKPNTINLDAPGLYAVYYAFDATISTAGDDIMIQPQLAGDSIIGSSLVASPTEINTTQAYSKEFYVSKNRPTTLTFMQTSTNTTDVINTFTVTVIRVN